MSDYVSRQYLLNEYDRQHQGPPGGARKIIAKVPAEDVAPVVHSEWIYHMFYGYGICKKCDYEYRWKDTDAKNYCPNCGAKMDEGKLTEREKAELTKKEIRKEKEEAVNLFIVISIFIFILCGVSIIID